MTINIEELKRDVIAMPNSTWAAKTLLKLIEQTEESELDSKRLDWIIGQFNLMLKGIFWSRDIITKAMQVEK